MLGINRVRQSRENRSQQIFDVNREGEALPVSAAVECSREED